MRLKSEVQSGVKKLSIIDDSLLLVINDQNNFLKDHHNIHRPLARFVKPSTQVYRSTIKLNIIHLVI